MTESPRGAPRAKSITKDSVELELGGESLHIEFAASKPLVEGGTTLFSTSIVEEGAGQETTLL